MKPLNKTNKIFQYLADHGETSRETLMKIAGTSSLNYFEKLISAIRNEHNQGVYTILMGNEVHYELNTALPYTFTDEPMSAADMLAADRDRYQRRNEPLT